MTEMTPRERVVTLFNKEPIDIMPVYSGQGMVLIQAIQEMGIRFPQVHTSAEYLAGSAIKTAEMFGFDALIIPYDMCTIPEAMGRGISLCEESASQSRECEYSPFDHSVQRFSTAARGQIATLTGGLKAAPGWQYSFEQ